jgi:hypothetical protein
MRIRDTRSAYFWLFRSCVTRYFGDTLHPLISTCFWVESKIVIAKLSRFEGLCFSYVLLQCILVYILTSHLRKGFRTNKANKFSTLLSLHPRWLSSSIYFTFYFTICLRAFYLVLDMMLAGLSVPSNSVIKLWNGSHAGKVSSSPTLSLHHLHFSIINLPKLNSQTPVLKFSCRYHERT